MPAIFNRYLPLVDSNVQFFLRTRTVAEETKPVLK